VIIIPAKLTVENCETLLKESGLRQREGIWFGGDAWSLQADEVPFRLRLREDKIEIVLTRRPFLIKRDQALLEKKISRLSEGQVLTVAGFDGGSLSGQLKNGFYSCSAVLMALFGCLITLTFGIALITQASLVEALPRVTALTELMPAPLSPFPDLAWYESAGFGKSLGAGLLLSFMITFFVGIGVTFGMWLSENFKVYSRAWPMALCLWPLCLFCWALLEGSGFLEALFWALASVMVVPGYLFVLSRRRAFEASEKNTKRFCLSLLLPVALAALLFLVLIASKIPGNSQMGVDSAITIRDDVLKKTSLGTTISNAYYNNVIAANLFVRSFKASGSLEEDTLSDLIKNGVKLPRDFVLPKASEHRFRKILKNQGFQLLQYLGIPLLMLWSFFGISALLFRGSGSKVLGIALLLLLFVWPVKSFFRDDASLRWTRERAFMLPLLHQLEASPTLLPAAVLDKYKSQDLKIQQSYNKNSALLFEELDKAALSENAAERAMALASLEAFLAIRGHLVQVRLPDSFYHHLYAFETKHLARLIKDEDNFVAYWALHLVVHLKGLPSETLNKISEAVISRLDAQDLNVRDKAVLALGGILEVRKEKDLPEIKALLKRQGDGLWKNSPEECDYIKSHLLLVLIKNRFRLP
jgi:hypothetical protein